ncbi:MAG: hypothetical protein ACKO04_00405 [Actinomycetes bacterium]
MDPKLLRRVVLVVFLGGIAGMVVGSIMDNNGTAVTFGILTAVAALALILTTALVAGQPADRFDDDRAESVEARIQQLFAAGADEQVVRDLVRESVLLGRTARPADHT